MADSSHLGAATEDRDWGSGYPNVTLVELLPGQDELAPHYLTVGLKDCKIDPTRGLHARPGCTVPTRLGPA